MHLKANKSASHRRIIFVLGTTLVVISLSIIWRYSRQRPSHEVVKKLSRDDWDFFSIPDDASSVEIYSTPFGIVSISYLVEDKFPATKTIEAISTELRSRGWNLLSYSEISPNAQSSDFTEWRNDAITSEIYGKRAYQRTWEAQWKNENGEVIHGNLSYPRSGSNITVSDSLYVDFTWQSSETSQELNLIEDQLIEMRNSGSLPLR